MKLNDRISAFLSLRKLICDITDEKNEDFSVFQRLSEKAENHNPWFIKKYSLYVLQAIAEALSPENIEKWLNDYPDLQFKKGPKRIGVVMAGNIPLAGFFDMMCVLMSGNIFIGKLSSKDDILIRFLTEKLIENERRFKDYIVFEEARLKEFDAIIATGSDNTSRYFDHYFGKYPNIIRKNRNSVAVLEGNESDEQLQKLADDIFLYFGLGCRSVSKLFVPAGYDFDPLFNNIKHYEFIKDFDKYANNYDYNRSVYLVNGTEHMDNGFVLVRENESYSAPIATIHYEYYKNITVLEEQINKAKDKIQCVVSNNLKNSVHFGESQKPKLWDYADGVDTMKFLLEL